MNALPKVLLVGLACIVTPMVMILLIGLTAGAGASGGSSVGGRWSGRAPGCTDTAGR